MRRPIGAKLMHSLTTVHGTPSFGAGSHAFSRSFVERRGQQNQRAHRGDHDGDGQTGNRYERRGVGVGRAEERRRGHSGGARRAADGRGGAGR
jgi:hypothetical protein